jgi:hypothetical protein
VKIILAILTALTLLVGQLGVGAGPAKPPCCTNCAGQCCVKSESAPVSAPPLAPAPASPAPNVELMLASVELPASLRSVEISPSVSPTEISLAVATVPLYRRFGGLLL